MGHPCRLVITECRCQRDITDRRCLPATMERPFHPATTVRPGAVLAAAARCLRDLAAAFTRAVMHRLVGVVYPTAVIRAAAHVQPDHAWDRSVREL